MKEKIYRVFDKIGEFAILALLFFIPISAAMIESFSGIILFCFIVRKAIKPDFRFIRFWPNIFLLVFFIFCAFSIVNSGEYLGKSLNALLFKWGKFIILYIIIQDSLNKEKMFKRCVIAFLFGASLVVLSGLTQRFMGFEFLRHKSLVRMDNGFYAISSSFNHYNALAAYLVVAILLAISLFLGRKSAMNKKGILILTFIVISIAVLFLTFSRGGWLALAITLAFVTILSQEYKKIILLVFILLFFLLSPLVSSRLLSIFDVGGDADRFKYWQAAFSMIKEHPFFGNGIGTFMANFSKYQPNLYPAYAHNCYLQIWAETGIFSLISFVIFSFSVIYLGIRKFYASRDFILLGLVSGLFCFLVHSFFDAHLYSLQLAALFWVWIALISAKVSNDEV